MLKFAPDFLLWRDACIVQFLYFYLLQDASSAVEEEEMGIVGQIISWGVLLVSCGILFPCCLSGLTNV